MSDNILRKKTTGEAGNGGEFGTKNHGEADIGLAGPSEIFTARQSGQNGAYRLDNDQTDPPAEKIEYGYRKVFAIGGYKHMNARLRAISAQITEEQRFDALTEAQRLAADGEKMTLLCVRRQNGEAWIYEGTGGNRVVPTLMAKASRTKGWHLDDMNIVAVKSGYGGVEKFTTEYNELADTIPAVDLATFDDIPSTDGMSDTEEPTDEIAAVYLVDGPNFGDGSTAGCLWLVTDTQDDAAIANGYFWAPDGGTSFSEHGSILTADLAKQGGRIRDYKPGLTFSGVMNGVLGGDRKSAYAAVLNSSD